MDILGESPFREENFVDYRFVTEITPNFKSVSYDPEVYAQRFAEIKERQEPNYVDEAVFRRYEGVWNENIDSFKTDVKILEASVSKEGDTCTYALKLRIAQHIKRWEGMC